MLLGEDLTGPWVLTLIGVSFGAFFALMTLVGHGRAHNKDFAGRVVQLLSAVGYVSMIVVIVNAATRVENVAVGASWAIAVLATLSGALAHLLALQILRLRRLGHSMALVPDDEDEIPTGYSRCIARTNKSVSDYRDAIIEAESAATELMYIQVRIPPFYYSAETIKHVAELRFGEGSRNIPIYMHEHQERARHHRRLLADGVHVREVYPRQAIESFVRTGTHSGSFWPLTPKMVCQALKSWRDELITYANYSVGISSDPIPSKYQLLSNDLVVFHSPIGGGDSHRLNSLFIMGEEISASYCADFEYIWERIPREDRDSLLVAEWIETHLIPLAQGRADQVESDSVDQ